MSAAKNEHSSYEALLHSDPRIPDRYELLWRVFEDVLELVGPKGIETVHLNACILANAVISYFDDIDRLKDYHGIELADASKQAAFTMKWIVREHPIVWLIGKSTEETKFHILLNDIFALRAALCFLQIPPDYLSKEFICMLLYTLK
jgi:hypothetical protein